MRRPSRSSRRASRSTSIAKKGATAALCEGIGGGKGWNLLLRGAPVAIAPLLARLSLERNRSSDKESRQIRKLDEFSRKSLSTFAEFALAQAKRRGAPCLA